MVANVQVRVTESTQSELVTSTAVDRLIAAAAAAHPWAAMKICVLQTCCIGDLEAPPSMSPILTPHDLLSTRNIALLHSNIGKRKYDPCPYSPPQLDPLTANLQIETTLEFCTLLARRAIHVLFEMFHEDLQTVHIHNCKHAVTRSRHCFATVGLPDIVGQNSSSF
jgi:hypothetical protein